MFFCFTPRTNYLDYPNRIRFSTTTISLSTRDFLNVSTRLFRERIHISFSSVWNFAESYCLVSPLFRVLLFLLFSWRDAEKCIQDTAYQHLPNVWSVYYTTFLSSECLRDEIVPKRNPNIYIHLHITKYQNAKVISRVVIIKYVQTDNVTGIFNNTTVVITCFV